MTTISLSSCYYRMIMMLMLTLINFTNTTTIHAYNLNSSDSVMYDYSNHYFFANPFYSLYNDYQNVTEVYGGDDKDIILSNSNINIYGPNLNGTFRLMLPPRDISLCSTNNNNTNNMKYITLDASTQPISEYSDGLLIDNDYIKHNSCTIGEMIYNILQFKIFKLDYIIFPDTYTEEFRNLLYNHIDYNPTYDPTNYDSYGSTLTPSSTSTPLSTNDDVSDSNIHQNKDGFIHHTNLPSIVIIPTDNINGIVNRINDYLTEVYSNIGNNNNTNIASPYYVDTGDTIWNLHVTLSDEFNSYPYTTGYTNDETNQNKQFASVMASIIGALLIFLIIGALASHSLKKSNQLKIQQQKEQRRISSSQTNNLGFGRTSSNNNSTTNNNNNTNQALSSINNNIINDSNNYSHCHNRHDNQSITDHHIHHTTCHNPSTYHTPSYYTNDTTTTSSYSAPADTSSSYSAPADTASSSCF